MREVSESEIARLKAMSQSEIRLRSEGFCRIAGVDEAGRGPLAGPVVAACCILPGEVSFVGLNDSKQVSAEQRDILFQEITTTPNLHFGVGIVDVATIDRINILQATFLAMQKAVGSLAVTPDYILVDGSQLPLFDIPSESVVQGDRLSVSIAAASIIAKVTRDRIMHELDSSWPHYGFKQHKGYATEAHIAAILNHGPSPVHRKSFDPVKTMIHPQLVQIDLF
jgi:ribonuclease HII